MPTTRLGVELVRAPERYVVRKGNVARLFPRPNLEEKPAAANDWPAGLSVNTSLESLRAKLTVRPGNPYLVLDTRNFRRLALWMEPDDNTGHRFVRPESDAEYREWLDFIRDEQMKDEDPGPTHPLSQELFDAIVPDAETGVLERKAP